MGIAVGCAMVLKSKVRPWMGPWFAGAVAASCVLVHLLQMVCAKSLVRHHYWWQGGICDNTYIVVELLKM